MQRQEPHPDILTKISSDSPAQARQVTIIEPPSGWQFIRLREIWQFRDLLYYLSWRDVKVRYKQTVLGVFWAILQPLMTMVVFSIFFGGFAEIPSDGIPYPIFSFTALVPWTFFSSGVTSVSNSLVGNSSMLKKIYFPRIIIPITQLFSALVDFMMAFAVLIFMIIVYSLLPSTAENPSLIQIDPVKLIWLPVFLLMAFASALSIGLWLAALNVQFRDVRHSVGFIVRLWMFITPVIYPLSLVEERWQLIYSLNPMTSVIEGFRWSLLGQGTGPGPVMLVSAIVISALLISGLFYFNRMEKNFADVV